MWKSTVRDDRYLLYQCELIISLILHAIIPLGDFWYVSDQISDNGDKNMIRSEKAGEFLVPEQGWKYYNDFSNCTTVRLTKDLFCYVNITYIYSGRDPNKPCIFPFTYRGKIIEGCTTVDGDSQVCFCEILK